MAAMATLLSGTQHLSPTPCDDVTPASFCLSKEPPGSRLRRGRRGWAELVGMSGGGTETPVACDAAQGGGGKKRDSLGTPGAAHLIIKGTEWRAWSSVRGVGSVLGTAPPGAPRLSPALPPPSAAWPASSQEVPARTTH